MRPRGACHTTVKGAVELPPGKKPLKPCARRKQACPAVPLCDVCLWKINNIYVFYGVHIYTMTTWPSGLRRCVKAAVFIGVGSNPTVVTFFFNVPSLQDT